MAKHESVKWTGKNLADVRKLHKGVAHYPEEEGQVFYRDASQHPDNLHVEADGMTLVLGIGDTLQKDEDGRLSVVKGDTPPRQLPEVPEGQGRILHAGNESVEVSRLKEEVAELRRQNKKGGKR